MITIAFAGRPTKSIKDYYQKLKSGLQPKESICDHPTLKSGLKYVCDKINKGDKAVFIFSLRSEFDIESLQAGSHEIQTLVSKGSLRFFVVTTLELNST